MSEPATPSHSLLSRLSHSFLSRLSSLHISLFRSPSSDRHERLPAVRPTATTPPLPEKTVHPWPTPSDEEKLSCDPSSEDARLEEGIIDLRAGTDYSRYPDVFQYLQFIGEALGKSGDAITLAEEGRRHLLDCKRNKTGLFVPGKSDEDHPSSHNLIRYDEAIAARQPPYEENTWIDILAANISYIGDTAISRRHQDGELSFPFGGSYQHDRVIKGLGWAVPYLSFSYFHLGGLLPTNIRAPIPKFVKDAPLPHSPRYLELIDTLYGYNLHVVPYALAQPKLGPRAVLASLYWGLRQDGFSVLTLRIPKPRYMAPWADWNGKAEERYAQRHDPERYRAWTKECEEMKAKGPVEYTQQQFEELRGRLGQKQCCHSVSEQLCSACKAKKRELENFLWNYEPHEDGEEWWDSDSSSSDLSCYDHLDSL